MIEEMILKSSSEIHSICKGEYLIDKKLQSLNAHLTMPGRSSDADRM